MYVEFVSVIIPAYNVQNYIRQAIDSVLAQTYHAFEIIVVDDGSTDNTHLIVKEFGDVIRYIYQDNRGLAAARNTGIQNSRAKIIALLDADDLWEPQFLDRMVGYLDMHPDASGAYCGFQYIDERGCAVGKPSLKVLPPERFHEALIVDGNWLSACAVIFRKHLAEDIGLFDESLHAVEDWDLWIRLSENQPFVGLPEVLVKYRRHEDNMSKDPERMINAIYNLRQKMYGPAEGEISTWSSPKKKAFSDLYRGAFIRFFMVGEIEKSTEYLRRLVEISPEYACSLSVWRDFARAHISEVHQFESSPSLDWVFIQLKLNQLFEKLIESRDHFSNIYSLYSKLKGFAFLALADEAGRSGELGWVYKCLKTAVRIYPNLLFERPFWGTIFRSISSLI